jgi:hypothetical protein
MDGVAVARLRGGECPRGCQASEAAMQFGRSDFADLTEVQKRLLSDSIVAAVTRILHYGEESVAIA